MVRNTAREIAIHLSYELSFTDRGVDELLDSRLTAETFAALAGEDVQVILSVGEQVDIAALGPLPENVSVYPQVDQIAVLEKADVFLSHCGMNSASESLYFGVPLLCYPQTREQGGVAARVTALGAGLMLENPSVSCIKAAVKRLLSDTKIKERAEEIARSFHRCTGPIAAADKIEQVIGT